MGIINNIVNSGKKIFNPGEEYNDKQSVAPSVVGQNNLMEGIEKVGKKVGDTIKKGIVATAIANAKDIKAHQPLKLDPINSEIQYGKDKQAYSALQKQYNDLSIKRNKTLVKAFNAGNISLNGYDDKINDISKKLINKLSTNPDSITISNEVRQSYSTALDEIKKDKLNTFNEVKQSYLDITKQYSEITGEKVDASGDLVLLNNASADLYNGIAVLEKHKGEILDDIQKKTKDILEQNKETINNYSNILKIYQNEKNNALKTGEYKSKLIAGTVKIYSNQLKVLGSQMKDMVKKINNEASVSLKYKGLQGSLQNILGYNSKIIQGGDLKVADAMITTKLDSLKKLQDDKGLSNKDYTQVTNLRNRLENMRYNLSFINDNIKKKISNGFNFIDKDSVQSIHKVDELTNEIVNDVYKGDKLSTVQKENITQMIKNNIMNNYVNPKKELYGVDFDSLKKLEDFSKNITNPDEVFGNFNDIKYANSIEDKLGQFRKTLTSDGLNKVLGNTKLSTPIKTRLALNYLYNTSDVKQRNGLDHETFKDVIDDIAKKAIKKGGTKSAVADAIKLHSSDISDITDNTNGVKDMPYKLNTDDVQNYVNFKVQSIMGNANYKEKLNKPFKLDNNFKIQDNSILNYSSTEYLWKAINGTIDNDLNSNNN